MIKTKNFNLESDPKLACACGHEQCDKRAVKQEVLDMVQKVRDDYGYPMVITSGGRCHKHPNEVQRAKPADHQKCQAVDVKVTGLTMAMRLMAIATKHGFNAFGISLKDNFIHLGYRPEQDTFSTWTY